jgi:ABC-2 type transport system permease protein
VTDGVGVTGDVAGQATNELADVAVAGRVVAPPALPEQGRARSMFDAYLTLMKSAVLQQFQYRGPNYFYMIGMVAEPVVYLVVWSSIARSQGGEVAGYTPGAFAAYYIVWTLVRNINIVFTPYGWEERIKQGQLSGDLLRPIHPIHYDLAFFAGWKVVVIVLWLPIAAVLSLAFHPSLSPTALQCVVFFFALWGAYLIRSLNMWVVGMITFWTTRVNAIFDVIFVAELLLSGRLVPLAVMPQWAQTLTWFFPFRWTFAFPITALVGPITNEELLGGLLMQLFWIGVGALAVRVVWKRAVRRFSAVGG